MHSEKGVSLHSPVHWSLSAHSYQRSNNRLSETSYIKQPTTVVYANKKLENMNCI
jgi:hypothetical protein